MAGGDEMECMMINWVDSGGWLMLRDAIFGKMQRFFCAHLEVMG